jgi:glycosyltransferase involved in cell wall biosynthesis
MISVIIPAYNVSAYICEAIQSVLDQTIQVGEILVIDDGSTDDTLERAASFGGRVSVSSHMHAGPGSSRNIGAHLARHDFLSFLDADDRWAPDKTERQIETFQNAPQTDIVFGHVQQFLSPDLPDEVRSRLDCPDRPMPGYHAAAMMIRRETFFRVGMFATDVKVGEFLDWYLRAVHLGLRSVVLPSVVLERRIHGSNLVLRESESRSDYARIVKAALDRRRATKGPA